MSSREKLATYTLWDLANKREKKECTYIFIFRLTRAKNRKIKMKTPKFQNEKKKLLAPPQAVPAPLGRRDEEYIFMRDHEGACRLLLEAGPRQVPA